MTIAKESKRILSVSIQRIDDPDGDWSWLGDFSDDPKDYAIVHVGEHSGTFEDQLPCECGNLESEHTPCDDGLGDSSRGDVAWLNRIVEARTKIDAALKLVDAA